MTRYNAGTEEHHMRTRLNILASVAVLSLFAVGCSPTPDSDTREADAAAIREADLAWSQANEVEGLEGAMSFYLDDAIMLPPNLGRWRSASGVASPPVRAPRSSKPPDYSHPHMIRRGRPRPLDPKVRPTILRILAGYNDSALRPVPA